MLFFVCFGYRQSTYQLMCRPARANKYIHIPKQKCIIIIMPIVMLSCKRMTKCQFERLALTLPQTQCPWHSQQKATNLHVHARARRASEYARTVRMENCQALWSISQKRDLLSDLHQRSSCSTCCATQLNKIGIVSRERLLCQRQHHTTYMFGM